jgi:hypothetical protein
MYTQKTTKQNMDKVRQSTTYRGNDCIKKRFSEMPGDLFPGTFSSHLPDFYLGLLFSSSEIFARDSKNLISTNFYELAVKIENINDNLPVCDPTTYSKTIAENTAVATTILTVTCTDADGAIDR